MTTSISSVSCMLLNYVVVTSRCHQALKHKNRLVSLTSCQRIFMWCRMIHCKGKDCKMLLIANDFFLTLPLVWNQHKPIHLPTDSGSARSTHSIPLGKWVYFAPDRAFILERNQRVWNQRPIHTPGLLFCLCIGKMWKSPAAARSGWVRMIFALKTQGRVCSEKMKSCHFLTRVNFV